MNFRRNVLTAHRWLSLAALAFWVVQAATGIFAVFHWEIDDAVVRGEHRATDFKAIEQRLVEYAPPDSGREVSSIWTSAGARDRYDVNLSDRVVRIDGAGNVLRTRADSERFANGGWVNTLIIIHHDLLAGDRGRMIVGLSGLLLLSNLILGVIVAWPRSGQWRRALRPTTTSSRAATLYSWHRAGGLWLVLPAICMVTAGMLLAFEVSIEALLNPPAIEAPPQAAAAPRVGLAAAVETALTRYPGAMVSGIGFPSTENPVWKITLRQQGELQRSYGKTRVFVSAVDRRILADFNALSSRPSRRLLDHLFSFHTGEMAGTPGRLIVIVIGLWLLAMIALGVALFLSRRPLRK